MPVLSISYTHYNASIIHDVTLEEDDPATNYDGETYLILMDDLSADDSRHVLMRFNLSGLGANYIIYNATLCLSLIHI